MKRIGFTLSFLVFAFFTLLGQVPEMFNYQATLRDNSGQLLTSKEVSLRISILQSSSSGASLYTETHLTTTSNQGIINLQIGRGTTSDNLSAIDWNNGPYFLKVELDQDGGSNFMAMGTSEFTSVPFALHAISAGRIDWQDVQNKPVLADVAITGNYYDLQSLPIVPTNTNQLINGSGFITSYTETDPIFSSSPAKSITSMDRSNWTSAFNWGNHANAGYAKYPAQLNNNGRFLATDGTTPYWAYAVNSATLPLYISQNVIAMPKATSIQSGYLSNTDWNMFNSKISSPWSTAGSNIYFNGGYVGIGTSSPVSLLNITGNVDGGSERNLIQIYNINDNALSYVGIKLKAGNSEGHSVIQDYSMNYTASPAYDFRGFLNVSNNNRGVMMHANSVAGVIKFYTGHDDAAGAGIERMRISYNGNVGIGTDEPNSKLQITDGDVYISSINSGIIMKSPDEQCWRGTINNSGVLEFAAVACP